MNHLWQSTIFALAAALLTLAVRKNHARIRHSIWLVASLKFLIPFSLLVSAGSHVRWTTPPPPSPRVARTVRVISQPFSLPTQYTAAPTLAPRPSLLPIIWGCGFAGVLFFWYIRWRRVRNIVRAASPIDLGAPVITMSSPALLEPGVFGIFRPVLMLPEGILERLTPQQLQAIVAHELCHVRRRDNLAAAMHMVVESIFWFHPLVWWIGSRLVDERERACDEEVLRQGSAPEVYAEGILNVCRFYVESPLTCVSGVTGSDLKKRIEGIMTHRVVRGMSFGRRLMLATVGCMAIVLPMAIGLLNAQSPAPHHQFEVASIKRNTSGSPGGLFGSRSPGMFNAENLPLRMIIAGAYLLKTFQVAGGPGWIDSDRYDITAKLGIAPPAAAGSKQSRQLQEAETPPMLQSLLEDRFQLKAHRETRELPVYALTVAKGGLKMHEGPCTTYDPAKAPARPSPGKMSDFCGNIGIRKNGPNRIIDAFGISIAEFVEKELPNLTERIVIDKTGLTGKFNIHLEFAGDDAAGDDTAGPSLFTAVEEQLGLKLESTKGPVEILVIDHIDRPSEN